MYPALQRFRPITVERPNVLLPLVNAPLLDYTLEWLASNDVEEVPLLPHQHSDTANVLCPQATAAASPLFLTDFPCASCDCFRPRQVFLFCCSNADKVQEYVNSTKWGSDPSFDVKVVVSTNCFSAGEAMRLIDQQDIIKGAPPPKNVDAAQIENADEMERVRHAKRCAPASGDSMGS
jgi:translation initiation factor eIF-2B subunit epsilon